LSLRNACLADQCRQPPAISQITAKALALKLSGGALETPKLKALIGVTTPITMQATATLLRPVASSFVCSL